MHMHTPHLLLLLGCPAQDPAALVGLPALLGAAPPSPPFPGEQPAAAPALPLPTWVHGDLTAENILLQPPEEASVAASGGSSPGEAGSGSSSGTWGATLIDFADGGQGDPLWDLIPLYMRSLQ